MKKLNTCRTLVYLLFLDARYPEVKLIEQKIPKKYKLLHEFVIAKAAVMRRHKETPILKLEDLKQYVLIVNICRFIVIICRSSQQSPVEELNAVDDMELYYGLEYLKDNGIISAIIV